MFFGLAPYNDEKCVHEWIPSVLEIRGALHTFSAKISAKCQPHVQFYDLKQSQWTWPGKGCKNDFILLNFFEIKKFTSVCFCGVCIVTPLFFSENMRSCVAEKSICCTV